MHFRLIAFIGMTFLFSSSALYHSQSDPTQTDGSFLPTGIYPISNEKTAIEKYYDNDEDTYFIVSKPIIALERFVSVKIEQAQDATYGLTFVLDETGKQQLTEASTNGVGEKWAFIVSD
jgi:hypothetical protein